MGSITQSKTDSFRSFGPSSSGRSGTGYTVGASRSGSMSALPMGGMTQSWAPVTANATPQQPVVLQVNDPPKPKKDDGCFFILLLILLLLLCLGGFGLWYHTTNSTDQ